MPSWLGEYLMGQQMARGTAAESVAERHAQPYHATRVIILVLMEELRNRGEKETSEWICYLTIADRPLSRMEILWAGPLLDRRINT